MDCESLRKGHSGTAATLERSHCVVCGSVGTILFQGLKDLWYGTPGSWDVLCCADSDCRLAWLSPYPRAEFIGQAYEKYYTHSTDSIAEEREVPRRGLMANGLDFVHSVTGLALRRARREGMYLGGVPPGRLLELGCGDGTRLLLFRGMGWVAQGQDVDPKAVETARRRSGCIVHSGSLDALELPKGSYDAIVMNHVLEHVSDPESLLRICSDLLVPGGRLVCAVPNLGSPTAREFGPHWWGLDPPRHLFHFSSRNLLSLAEKAGLAGSAVFTAMDNHEFWLVGSYFIRGRAGGDIELLGRLSVLRKLQALARQYGAFLQTALCEVEGDECILQWQKPVQRQLHAF